MKCVCIVFHYLVHVSFMPGKSVLNFSQNFGKTL